MTEQEFASLKEFKELPVYNDDDPSCESIDTVGHDTSFTGSVLEADNLPLAMQYLARADLVPKGGIRHHGDGGSTIFAYFWKKR